MAFRISATQARARWGGLIRRVTQRREAVIVERHGKPCLVLIPFEDYEPPRSARQTEAWQETLNRLLAIGSHIRAARAGRPLPPPEEVIREMREERDGQLADLR